jgi:hypothetical protein
VKQSGDYVETNCRIVEKEQEDKVDSKSGNLVRTIKTKKVCDLIPGKLKQREGITIKKSELTRIIREEIDYVIQQVSDRVSVEKSSFDTLLNKAAKCVDDVVDDEDAELMDEKCGDETPGNRLHRKDGTWGTKETNTSWSLQNKGCGASQMRPGSNVRRATSLPCGALARKQGKDVPCKGKSK